MAGRNVFANGMEISGKSSSNRTIAAVPDVCFSPPASPSSPVPIAYPNSAFAHHTTRGSRTVKIGRLEVGKKNISQYARSTGNEPATRNLGMGIISHNITAPMKFASWSMDVKIEGANVTRYMDLTTHNHANCGNGAEAVNCGTAVPNTKALECDGLGEMVSDHRACLDSSSLVTEKRLATANRTCTAAVLKVEETNPEYMMAWSRGLDGKFRQRHRVQAPNQTVAEFSHGIRNPKAQVQSNGRIKSNICGGIAGHDYVYKPAYADPKYTHTESRILEDIWTSDKMKLLRQKIAAGGTYKRPEITFCIEWLAPDGSLRQAPEKKSANQTTGPEFGLWESSDTQEGRDIRNTSCDPCSGALDSCLGLLCAASTCMDVYVCEMTGSETETVTEPDTKKKDGTIEPGKARVRNRPTAYKKTSIVKYCEKGRYPPHDKATDDNATD